MSIISFRVSSRLERYAALFFHSIDRYAPLFMYLLKFYEYRVCRDYSILFVKILFLMRCKNKGDTQDNCKVRTM